MRRLKRSVSVLVLVIAGALAGPASADELRGVALVIGAADYETLTDLGNPLNDARAMDDMLSELGFDVTRVLDRGAERMRREIEDFIADAEGADVALVYFAGHAVEIAGQNFLVPVDADLSSPEAAGRDLVAASDLLDELARTVPVTIMLLDACRTEAFPNGTPILLPGSDAPVTAVATGLGEMRGPTPVLANVPPESLGMVIGFAAAPGQPALDGPADTNSPYAAALLKHLGAGGLSFGDVMTLVSEEVYLKTGARQIPWVNSSLRRVLSFEAVEEIEGDEALIRDGRRRLLLSISSMPSGVKRQVEAAASNAAVPMDTLYGLLGALGAEAPSDPGELDKLLKSQTETIRRVTAEREALTSTDTEIVRLADLAQRALDEGALAVSVDFWEQAKARYLEISASLDQTEALLRERRLEGGALLASAASAHGLNGDFAAAAENFGLAFDEVARWDDKRALEYKRYEAEALYLEGLLSGDNAAIAEAIRAHAQSLALVEPGSHVWAEVQYAIGTAHAQLATRDATDASVDSSAAAYRAAMDVFEREGDTISAARAQVRLATVLSVRAERVPGTDVLLEAVAILENALKSLPPERDPFEWGAAQNNLGNVLRTLGERQADVASFAKAADTFRNAISVLSPESHPYEWTSAQTNLGGVLVLLGMRDGSPETMRQSIAATESALSLLTQDQVPLQWAKAQGNLGAAYLRLGETENDVAMFERAATAFRAALEEFTPDRSLLDWATARNNLANAQVQTGLRSPGTDMLLAGVEGYREVARVLGSERAPLQWAQAHNNIGASLVVVGERTNDLAVLAEAGDAIHTALEIWTRDRVPLDWAMAQRNLGNVLTAIGIREGGTSNLLLALTAYRSAMEEQTKARVPLIWADIQMRVGLLLTEIGLREEAGVDRYQEALNAFSAATEIFTPEADPINWAVAADGAGWAFAQAGYRSGSVEMLQEGRHWLVEAQAAFKAAGNSSQDAYFAERIGLIDEVLASAAQTPAAP